MMEEITVHELLDWASRWVLYFSLASLLLPPVEFFEEFPRLQRWYRLACKFIKYWGALDFRPKVLQLYPSYQRAVSPAKETESK